MIKKIVSIIALITCPIIISGCGKSSEDIALAHIKEHVDYAAKDIAPSEKDNISWNIYVKNKNKSSDGERVNVVIELNVRNNGEVLKTKSQTAGVNVSDGKAVYCTMCGRL